MVNGDSVPILQDEERVLGDGWWWQLHNIVNILITNELEGLHWWLSGKIPHTAEQLSLCATTVEPVL